jgi:hypothetical protein
MPQVTLPTWRAALLVVAAMLAACGSGTSAPPTPNSPLDGQASGAARYAGTVDTFSNETIYALNAGGGKGSVTVYGKTPELLRTINLAGFRGLYEVVGVANLLFTTSVGRAASKYSGQLAIFKKRGARQSVARKIPVHSSLLVADSDGNAESMCSDWTICKYNTAGKTIGQIQLRHTGIGRITSMAADSKGDVAVASCCEVRVYSPFASTPYWTIPGGGLFDVSSIAFDSENNLYAVNSSYNLLVYPYRATSPSLETSDGLNYPSRVAVDESGAVYVLNSGSASIVEFQSGQTAPRRIITSGLDHPVAITVGRDQNLYVANEGGSSDSGSIAVYSPAVSTPLRTITRGIANPENVTVAPAQGF